MARKLNVHFYNSENKSADEIAHFCFQLSQHHYDNREKIYLHVPSQAEAERLDECFWSAEPASFLPHRLVGEMDDMPCPVVIGHNPGVSSRADVFINLDSHHQVDILQLINRYTTIIEFVPQGEADKLASRERFKAYRSSGQAVNYHESF
ncbi:MAG: DNA polymerase III subunit chi [Pseudomonadota bacterium]